ncbi:uncharacterized protein LOC141632059 [Silene latifolia]|uniref:uncharacterized protein LOC141632059 n=1 Tax=Silene latifolia TaxID=37657 RepID=UPI003D76C138
MKGYCKGEILCTVARDATNQMFPVACAVVEIESKESWSWFFGHLIQDLEMGMAGLYCPINKRSVHGLMIVKEEILPQAEHRLCARHIFINWIEVIKGVPLHTHYWRVVKAYTEKEFNDVMQQLRRQSERAYGEMCARDVTKFCRYFYKTWACTDVTCNNMAETFNSWILEAREKPILSILEEIRRQVMSRMVEKRGEAAKCNRVTPRIRAKLNEFRQATKNWVCACKYWDLNGVPCEHATSAICAINQDPESYVAFWYPKKSYEASYSVPMEPLNGQALWQTVEEGSILPSDPRIMCGRPPNKRKRAYGDIRRKRLKYRLPKSSKQLCSSCHRIGHNRRTCLSKDA